MQRKINFNYINRDYDSIKNDLMNYVKVYYPDQYNDFSESSVGMMLLELNAYVGDVLSYHVDHSFNEMFMDTAQNRDSVVKLAKNLGYKPRGKSPSAVLLEVSIEVPVLGTSYDPDYLITLEKNMKVTATNGQVYTVVDDIDFSLHYSITGIANRSIDPVYNNSNEIISYRITKTVSAVAGELKTASLNVGTLQAVPFYKWYPAIGDYNITEILNVISKDDRYAPSTETEWSDLGPYNVWYKVDTLPQQEVFVDSSVGDGAEGYWKTVSKRYEVDYNNDGDIYLTFGAGINGYNAYDDFLTNGISALTVATLLNNTNFGEIPEIGTWLHVRYRSGGGLQTNAAMGTINTVSSKRVSNIPGGPSLPAATLSQVIGSLTVTNPIPAIGGADFETIDEIKQNARKNFSSQDRCVTVDDYIAKVVQMPASYGSVFRAYASADPKSMNTAIYILTRDENGKLKNTGNDQIKMNVASWLQKYKVLNDFVVLYDGRIVNVGVNFAVQVQKEYNKKEIILNCIEALKNYFDITKWQMNSTIYLGDVTDLLMSQVGVVNVSSLEFINKFGGDYSKDILISNENQDAYKGVLAREENQVHIIPVNNKIRLGPTSMFEIKYPEKDIKGAAL